MVDVSGAAASFAKVFHEMHDNFREQVRGLDHGTLNWKPLPKANSIAVLVVHSLGSQREMLRAVRNIATERDRDSEFRAEAEAADLLALIDQADRDIDELLGAVTADDLTGMRPRGDNPPRPGIEWLITNYGHAREHLAQIQLTKQLYDSRT
ncbi:MAG TPA: DinB family protein [Candidatus Dormibacteraeota bacterium]